MANVKGNLLLTRLKYLREKVPANLQNQVNNLLSPTTKEKLEHILPASWYPIAVLYELMEAMNKVLAINKPKVLIELGRYSAHQSSKGIYKMFFVLASPRFILDRSASLWNQLVDSGKVEVKSLDKNKALFMLKNFPEVLPDVFVKSLSGWTIGILEVSGGKNVRLRISKSPNAADHDLHFEVQWE